MEEPEEVVNRNQESKNIPQTSSVFETYPQAFSPWYMNYSITPTFSPFFVNVPTFSSFDATLSNQFYCPSRPGDRVDQF